MLPSRQVAVAVLVVCAALAGAPADGAQRTFVATWGNDANACSFTAPCRSFGVAMAVTDSTGEIIALDSGGYGPVVITKQVTIQAAPGVYAGISVTSGIGIDINAQQMVALRGLTINGQGGDVGIRINAPYVRLTIENCVIANFKQQGIAYGNPVATGWLAIVDTVIRDNAFEGIAVTQPVSVMLERVRLLRNESGLIVYPNAAVTVHDSVIADSNGNNVALFSDVPGAGPSVVLDHVSVTGTVAASADGVRIVALAGARAQLQIIRSTIAYNAGPGVTATGAGTPFVSISDSEISDNAGDGLRLQSDAGYMLADGNAIFGNAGFGMNRVPNTGTGLFETRQNNTIRRNLSGATVGTITPAAGL